MISLFQVQTKNKNLNPSNVHVGNGIVWLICHFLPRFFSFLFPSVCGNSPPIFFSTMDKYNIVLWQVALDSHKWPLFFFFFGVKKWPLYGCPCLDPSFPGLLH